MDFAHFVYAILGGIIPALLWLFFWRREDHLHPEPRSTISGAFMIGMGAVVVSILLQKISVIFITDTTHQYVVWAIIEEILKFCGAYFIAFHSPDLDEPIDPLIYLITVALGFAALENTLFVMGVIQSGDYIQTIVTGNMRFIGATLLHVLASSCVGIMLGFGFYRSHFTRFLAGFIGLCAGVALHAYFNLSIISTTTVGALKIFGLIWIGIIILFMAFEELKGIGLAHSIPNGK